MTDTATVVEAFVVDPAFLDRRASVNGILLDQTVDVATLTPKALSYFNQPALMPDVRAASGRQVNWSSETNPQMVVDSTTFSGFVTTLNALTNPITVGLFKLIDKLVFNYNSNVTHDALETELISDPDISEIYVPGSFALSAQILSDTVYYSNGGTTTVNVPTFVKFTLVVPSGSTSVEYAITLYASSEAWLTGYNTSTIIKVIPPLSYDQLYSASLTTTTANIFATAADTAILNYTKSQTVLGVTTVSGIFEYPAVVTDTTGNTVTAPFNIIYKGRTPTLMEIRTAIKTELLASGVGNQAGWEARIPGIFVSGRFYIVPFWDQTYTRPSDTIFPSMLTASTIIGRVQSILESTTFSITASDIDLFPAYYNRITLGAVPDKSGAVDVNALSHVFPDYQSYEPSDAAFRYMSAATQEFATMLSTMLTIDYTGSDPGVYAPLTENLLTFYSFVVNKYEFCVITKQCYADILESIQ